MAKSMEEIKQDSMDVGEKYLEGYNQTINTHYSDILSDLDVLGQKSTLLPLHGLRHGHDVSFRVLATDAEFNLFFVRGGQDQVYITLETGELDRNWHTATPDEIRYQQILDRLKLTKSSIIYQLCYPGTPFITSDRQSVLDNARHSGGRSAQTAGSIARSRLPQLKEAHDKNLQFENISQQYQTLKTQKGLNVQERGRRFEVLVREFLNYYGWKARKIRIPGEEDDFTAIYQTNHILGEVRWYNDDKPMTGANVREFIAKLDPRPTTIGLMISQSGFDKGADAVARRSVNSKTVVFFDSEDIDSMFVSHRNPGELLDDKLRDIYDHVFESSFQT